MEAAQLRTLIVGHRNAIPPEVRLSRSDAIWKRLVEVPDFQTARQALFFITLGSEVETGVMRRMCRDLGMAVAAPRAESRSRSMHFHLLPDDDALIVGPYGVLQPPPEAPLAPLDSGSVVLVPGSVFDRSGNRLGMGGGFYDRWLADEGRGLPTIGLAYQEQVVERVPASAHDVPVDWLVTDQETCECGSKGSSGR